MLKDGYINIESIEFEAIQTNNIFDALVKQENLVIVITGHRRQQRLGLLWDTPIRLLFIHQE